MASWVNFIKEIPLNEISENLKILLKNVRGVNFPKEIPLNEFSENTKILLKNVVYKIQKIHIPIRIAFVDFAQKSEWGSIFQKKSLYKKKCENLQNLTTEPAC